jgi:hypothetical protein
MSTTAATSMTPVEQLLVESEITRLLNTYVHHLDSGKFAEIAALFGDATFEVMGTTVSGRENIEAFLTGNVRRHEDGNPRTSSVSYFTVHQQVEGLALQPICTGHYLDTFELHDGKWRFASRNVQPRFFGELSFHAGAAVDLSAL